jgi:Ca2+-binding RTX toxin-like protein
MATIQSVIDFVTAWRGEHGVTGSAMLDSAQLAQFAADLELQVSQLAVVPAGNPNATLIAYTGETAGTKNYLIAAELSASSNGTLFYATDTDAGALLSSKPFEDAVRKAVGDFEMADAIMHGREVNGLREPYGVGERLSIDDLVSKNIMMSASGDVLTITTDIQADKVFWATELPALLANEQVNTINGIPRQTLIELRDAGGDLRSAVAASSLIVGAQLKVNHNGTPRSLLELNLSDMGPNGTATLLNQGKLALASRAFQTVGVVGAVIELFDVAHAATARARDGDIAGASVLMAEFTARTAGGWAAGEAASVLVGQALAPLALGGPWGAATWFVLTAGAGILVGAVTSDIIQRLLHPPTGDAWDAQRAIDLASTDDEIGLAYRRALYFFDPLAPITQVNSSVDLSLYNPETRTGAITAEWIEARSKAMTAYTVAIDRRDTDGVLTYGFGVPFMTLSDVLITDSTLGSENSLRLDGVDTWTADLRHLKFGNENANTLLGDAGDDRLFGVGGDDLLVGGGGNDYLEGGVGNDTLKGDAGIDVLDGGAGNDEYVIAADAMHTTIRDSDGSGSITVLQEDGSSTTLGGAVEFRSDSGQFEDEDGNRYRLKGSNLTVALADSGITLIIEEFASMPGTKLGIDLQEPGSSTPTGGTYNVGAPNQLVFYPTIVNGDHTAFYAMIEAAGLYWTFRTIDEPPLMTSADYWLSPGGYFARNDTEIINVSAAIVDASHGQHAYAQASGGLGDSYITGDDGINFLVDDSSARLDDNAIRAVDRWPATGMGGLGLFPVEPNLALGIWGFGYDLADQVGNDRIDAGGGNDIVITHGGDDTVLGGDGDDILFDTHHGAEARPNQSYTYGEVTAEGVTYFYDWDTEWVNEEGHSSNDVIFGDAGNDYIAAHGGRQMLDGGADNDEVFGGADNDVLIGDLGDDVLAGDVYLYASPLAGSEDAQGNPIRVLHGDALRSDTEEFGNDLLDGGEGADTLIGGGGDDTLIGGDGADYIDGDFSQAIVNPAIRAGLRELMAEPSSLHGNDRIFADGGNDTVLGGAGDDDIDGGDGSDTITAGGGHDLVRGGDGADVIEGDGGVGSSGNDEIHGGDGADTIAGGSGADRLFGDADDDVIRGEDDDTASGNDWIEGGSGNDHLYGDRGNDFLSGGSGYDQLFGGEGSDTLRADTGGDLLQGGANNDTYVLNPGAGYVHIVDTEGSNTLHFTHGVPQGSIGLRRSGGLIYIDFGSADAAVMNQATFDTLQALQLEDPVVSLETSEMSIDELRRRFDPPELTNAAVPLVAGVAAADVAYTARNNDLILSYSASVVSWVDLAALGALDIEFAWKPASNYGITSPNPVLVLNNWYLADSATYVHELLEAGGARLDFTATANSIERRFVGTDADETFAGTAVRDVIFANGGADVLEGGEGNDSLSAGAGDDELSGGNGDDSLFAGDGSDVLFGGAGADFVSGEAGDDVVSGGAGNDNLRGGDGVDRLEGGDGNDSLTADAGADSLFGGSGNDSYWFGAGHGADTLFDSAGTSDFLSFQPGINATDVVLTESAAGVLVTIGAPQNGDSVLMEGGIDFMQFGDGTVWNAAQIDAHITDRAPLVVVPLTAQLAPLAAAFSYVVPAGTFMDPDPADTLTYSATLTDGSALPAWLGFDAGTRTFSGTRPVDDLTVHSIRVTATDPTNKSASSSFALNIAPSQVLGTSGADSLAGTAADDLIGGLAGADQLAGAAGSDTYVYRAGDGADVITETGGAADTLSFGSGITESDLTLTATEAGVNVRVGAAGSGNSILILSQLGSGGPWQPIEQFRFSDGTLWDAAEIDAHITERAPIVVVPLTAQLAPIGASFSYVVPAGTFMDPDPADVLTYSATLADGSALPAWLGFDAGTRTFSGTRPVDDLTVHSIRVVATDPTDKSASSSFALNISPNQLLGTGGADSLTGTAADDLIGGLAGADQLAGAAGNDTYVYRAGDGADVITETGGAADTVAFGSGITGQDLTLTETNDGLDVRVGAAGSGDSIFIFRAPGGALQPIEQFRFADGTTWNDAAIDAHITGNRAPHAGTPINAQVAPFGQPFSFVVPLDAFTDPDGVATLSLSATLVGGGALPAWLSFDAPTRTFSGTAQPADVGNLSIRLTATDPGGLFATTTLDLSVVEGVVFGTSGDDVLTGTAGANVIDGLAGNDTITGLDGNDTLYGGSGADLLDGGTGTDQLTGGTGDDTYVVDASGDNVIEAAGEGTDLVQSSVTYTLGGNVESLTLTGSANINGTGDALDNVINGNSGNNTLTGGAGNDTLYAGSAGTDSLRGGTGDDTYVVDRTAGVSLVENASEGTDNVLASVSVTLASNVENLTLTGSGSVGGTGNSGDNVITGNSGDNVLSGGSGNDTLTGGSAGNDTLQGGADNDTYIVDRAGVTLSESSGQGTDTVLASVSTTLSANIEILTLTGSASIDGTGNTQDNVLTGNSGNNTLNGGFGNDTLDGGAGADVLIGGIGNDTYIIDGVPDAVVEDAFSGTDTALASVSYALDAELEVLTLTGAADIDGTGNELANTITGNGGANVLTGGAGNDTLTGGGGSDAYVYNLGDGDDTITNAQDSVPGSIDSIVFGPGILPQHIVVQRDPSTTDGIKLSVRDPVSGLITGSITVKKGFDEAIATDILDEVRFLDAPGTVWTAAALRALYLLGTTGADTLTGFSSDDLISGGLGGDTLTGGGGSDTYVYNLGDGDDTITNAQDSAPGSIDRIRFGAGLLPQHVTVVRDSLSTDGAKLVVRDPANGLVAGSITIKKGFDDAVATEILDEVTFLGDPGTVWTAAGLRTLYLSGTDGADSITGFSSNDLIDAGLGNDSLTGGAGSDTYVYNRGDGDDTIGPTQDFAPGSIDSIVFGAGILPQHIVVQRDPFTSDGFKLSVRDPVSGLINGSITVKKGFDAAIATEILDEVRFLDDPGTVWTAAALRALYLVGTAGADTLTGFSTNDFIDGGAGDDTLNGGAGNDEIIGGLGDDKLFGGAGDDTFRFGRGVGRDDINDTAGVNRIALDAGILPADVALFRTSSAGRLGGDTSDQLVLRLNTGEQLWIQNVFGGQTPRPISEIAFADGTVWDAAAIDANTTDVSGTANSATGTTGDDSYAVDHRSDTISEPASGGVDTVTSSVSFTLPTNVENLTLTGSLDLFGTGNSLSNVLTGNAGANILNGGTANDTMSGGAGDDQFIVDTTRVNFFWDSSPELWNFSDTVIEQASEGYDVVFANNVYSATLPANTEKLVASGVISTTVSFNLTQDVRRRFTGNALNNVIDASAITHGGFGVGQTAAESIGGFDEGETVVDGGAGADVLIGPSRKTRFIVDDVGDVIIANGPYTTVESHISYTLAPTFQDLTLVGSAATTGTGNTLANKMDGFWNSAANTLIGGAGDDSYYVGSNDTIVEEAGGGVDTVFSKISYTLADHLENLTLTGTTGGLTGRGNALNNVITGTENAVQVFANNFLYGGLGNDTLIGKNGSDVYGDYDANTGHDVILDSAGTADQIQTVVSSTINVDLMQFTRVGDDLVMTIDASNSIRVQNWFLSSTYVIESLAINNDGLWFTYNSTQMQGRATGTNTGPSVYAGVFDASAETGAAFEYRLEANAFLDIESQNSMSYTATLDGGSALPSWLVFDSQTRTFSGTPTAAGTFTIAVTATDAGGLSATDTFVLDVAMGPIMGTPGSDVLNGDATDNVIVALAGDDTVNGLAGFDALYGDEGNDTLSGGADDDYLDGGDGDDTLDGGTGADEMYGWLGNDTYFVDTVNDYFWEETGEGTDLIRSSVTLTLDEAEFGEIENLTLTGSAAANGTGNTLANVLTGNSGNNTLTGGSGNDTLDPGSAGTDSLRGGVGNDTYIIARTSGVTVVENTGEGTDLVLASVTHTLASNVENLTLTGSSAINGTGNSLVNIITGNSGNNTLSGGTGADTLIGGLGNDTYTVDAVGDVVTELAGEGTDLVNASVTYTITGDVENLTLSGSTAISGTGNALDNALTGNSGSNTLSGGVGNDTLDPGSAGTDVLQGGAGNDIYVVTRTTGITITENSGEGIDRVNASVTHTLAANVENLTLTGSGAINGTGNTLDNALTGNSGSNTLSGGAGNDTLDPGSAGTDVLTGGTGNDTYVVSRTTGITFTENANEGIDRMDASVTKTLASNFEILFLTGSSAINGTGNTLANYLRGNGGNNTLAGGGGMDILEGGGANDILSNTSGKTLFNGGAGTDTLTGSSANDLLIGGAGNDALTTGSGADIIVFNKGDGLDTVAASTTKDNTLSLGGGVLYADLLFQKTGNDLILKIGASDQVTFTGYYASASNRSVDKLQVIIEGSTAYNPGSPDPLLNKKVETFNFDGLVTAFDAARAADPLLTTWALTNALAAQFLSGSDTAALGGDLAYRYGLLGTLSDISFTPALGILSAAGFGTSAQNLQSLASLQDSSVRLS